MTTTTTQETHQERLGGISTEATTVALVCFKCDTADHQMTVLHDDGLYRHLRFSNPDRSGYWFEIVTWPGSLAVRGDVGGGYVFSRTPDMLGFFRRNGNIDGINPDYWSEKLPAGSRSVREYSEDALKALIGPPLDEYEKAYPDLLATYGSAKATYDAAPSQMRWPYGTVKEPVEPTAPGDLWGRVVDYDMNGELSYEPGARGLLHELEAAGVVSDTWEWDLSDWDYSFLWFCHAIVWGIAQYDVGAAAKGA
jgi:hypothetical protein